MISFKVNSRASGCRGDIKSAGPADHCGAIFRSDSRRESRRKLALLYPAALWTIYVWTNIQ